ncbi:MAG TPA: nitroreductase family protein [Gaiellaceae bacterium]|nr:nitroreductase family protein [Gaiellaceae bacterium]
MDAFLAIASKRDERAYADTPIPEDVVRRILDCGRLSGSSRNTQQWEFVVVSGEAQQRLSEMVYAPENVATATLVVAVVGEAFPFDVGRCVQNMMLGAWNEGVVSCPNGIKERDSASALLGGEAKAVISFGYPANKRDVSKRSAEDWSAKAKRKSLDELVRRVS